VGGVVGPISKVVQELAQELGLGRVDVTADGLFKRGEVRLGLLAVELHQKEEEEKKRKRGKERKSKKFEIIRQKKREKRRKVKKEKKGSCCCCCWSRSRRTW